MKYLPYKEERAQAIEVRHLASARNPKTTKANTVLLDVPRLADSCVMTRC